MAYTFDQPDFETQSGTAYKTAIDNSIGALSRIGKAFAAHEQAVPAMTVRVDAGALFVDGAVVEVAAQSTGVITAPVVNPRIDRVIIDAETGTVAVVTGDEAAVPEAPAITDGYLPICQVALAIDTTEITNDLITDERIMGTGGSGTAEAFPIGSIYISVLPTDPLITLGYGTWVAFGTGKVLVGIDDADADFDTVEETGGAKTANLAHTHTVPNHQHGIGSNESGQYTTATGITQDGSYTYGKTMAGGAGTSGSGGSSTQSIMNPYIVVYMWKRTA